MTQISEQILRETNRVLEKVLEHYYTSIDSLSNKAGHFLSFSMILDSLLAGYLGALFLLVRLQLVALNIVFDYAVYVAIAFLISAIVCLLIIDIIGARSLSPKTVTIPIFGDIDQMMTTEVSYGTLTEWYVEHRQRLVDAIRENENVIKDLQKKVSLMGFITTLAAFLFICFIIATLALALGNVSSLNP